MEYPGFTGGSNVSQSPTADNERTMNWYPERSQSQGSTSKQPLYPTPGVESLPLMLPAIVDMAAPTVSVQGTPGASTYAYVIVAYLTDGTTHSAGMNGGFTTTGNATLSGVDFNRVTWTAAINATFYSVYVQDFGAGSLFKIASGLTVLTFDDIGVARGAADIPLTNTTGLALVPTGSGRATLFETNTERLFMVIGTVFYEMLSDYTMIWRGLVADDGSPATISSNGDVGQLLIVAGGNGYLFDVTTDTFATIAALAGIATQGDFLDGFGIVLDVNSSTVYLSDLLDFATWDPTQFIQRSDQADPWVSLKVASPYMWLLGKWTSSAWYDAGLSPIPFLPHPAGKLQYGCAATFSPEVVDGTLIWVGATANGSGSVVRLSGFTPEIVSTNATEVAFGAYASIADAVGDSYDDLGHTFYILTFPGAQATWGWDAQTQLWHERGTWISEEQEYTAWRPLFHAFAFEKHIMLDRENGSVYHMASELGFDVDERPIRRLRRPPALIKELKRLFVSRLELLMEPGLGLVTGQGSNPLVTIRMSFDGGKTWGNELDCSAGALGNYSTQIYWNRLGFGRLPTPEIVCSDPIPWRLLGAFVDIEPEVEAA